MNSQRTMTRPRGSTSQGVRDQLVASLPVIERRLKLAGISTAVLEGGVGSPVVLLHGPGEYAAKWMLVIPDLVKTHRVIAPDLPGHGTSTVPEGSIDRDRVIAWLGELIARTCTRSPTLVGQIIGGAIAARFAIQQPDVVHQLVLTDSLGLVPFQPAPEFGHALSEFVTEPGEGTHDRLWQRCAFDLDRLRQRMGVRWEQLRGYNIQLARIASLRTTQQSLFEQFGIPAIPAADLAKVTVPTTLIWGRHDLATRLEVAEVASARYGWPLHVIENAADDPPLEQPEAFVNALRAVLRDTPESK